MRAPVISTPSSTTALAMLEATAAISICAGGCQAQGYPCCQAPTNELTGH